MNRMLGVAAAVAMLLSASGSTAAAEPSPSGPVGAQKCLSDANGDVCDSDYYADGKWTRCERSLRHYQGYPDSYGPWHCARYSDAHPPPDPPRVNMFRFKPSGS